MKLVYKNKEVSVTTTTNPGLMRYKFQKLYYAIIIKNCNRYSSIASKQRIDIAMTDDNLKILSFKSAMHENTVYENQTATTTILLPLNHFDNLETGIPFTLKR